jgi:hypothetical protein
MCIRDRIKSGSSFFREEREDSYVYRMGDQHVAYWVGHSMPVVIVLYNPDTRSAHWQQVTRVNVECTGKHWKIEIPKSNMFENAQRTLADLQAITQPEPYIRRLNRLRVDRRLMDLVGEGMEVRVTFENWVNKSLPRYQVTIYTNDEKETWPTLYAPGVGVEAMLQHFFPWANYAVDENDCQENAESQWEAECYRFHDPEEGKAIYTEKFDEWYKSPNGLVPVSENGETESYVLILSLNEFGKSFMLVDNYLSDPSAPETIGFTLK